MRCTSLGNIVAAVTVTVSAILGTGTVLRPAAAAPRQADCVLVDSDAGLDDLRALAVLAPNRRIAAGVVTEGLATPGGGARALRSFLGDLGIPVLEGASAASDRDHDPRFIDGLARWRATAETLNGTISPPSDVVLPDVVPVLPIEDQVERLTEECARIELLAIGPWTSFLRYADRLIGRIDRVVAQGSPFPDDEVRGEPDGWNCRYDWNACREAFKFLKGRLRADWVDIPQGQQSCGVAEPGKNAAGNRVFAFAPTEQMAQALAPEGLPGRLARIMLNDPTGLERTSLWDDLAALYLLQPSVFGRLRDPSGRSGGHLEPCSRAEDIRAMLVRATSGALIALDR